MQKVSIVIPAHNEKNRISRTLTRYVDYFSQQNHCAVELLVVLNGCTDSTLAVVRKAQEASAMIRVLDLTAAGKGLAIKEGFLDALKRDNDLIGFVDADMATQPQYFDELITSIGDYDGVIASRYMRDADVSPARPLIKEWGRIIFYNSLIKLLFGLWYADFQCGAKLFKRKVIQVVAPQLTITQWAFDVELLYLCKRNGFRIKEIPTVWHDQDESKLRVMHSGLRMLGSVIRLRIIYSPFSFLLQKKDYENET